MGFDNSGKKNVGVLVLLVTLVLFMLVVVVIIARSVFGGDAEAVSESSPALSSAIEADGRIKGADLSAFLRDESFFDKDDSDKLSSNRSTGDFVDGDGNVVRDLTLLASSVERDIRIKIVDEKGNAVEGHDFTVEIADTGVYIDEDKDGVICVDDIKPGEYYVTLRGKDGFTVPDGPAKVRVKSIVSYTPIEDISYFVHKESEVDILKDDTAQGGVSGDDEDDTQYKSLLDGDKDGNPVSLGIDVSKWNGEIDWDVVKAEGIGFAIIRCGYRGSSSGWLIEDPYFMKNLEGAKRAGIKVGVYFFTQAVSLVEAVEEASTVLSLLGDAGLDFPVFIDSEGAGGNGRADGLDAATRTALVNAFCQTVQNAGREAGVYASRNWYMNNLNLDELCECRIWLAEYRQTPEYEYPYDMWQYTSDGSVAGIDGRVDLNVSYLGY